MKRKERKQMTQSVVHCLILIKYSLYLSWMIRNQQMLLLKKSMIKSNKKIMKRRSLLIKNNSRNLKRINNLVPFLNIQDFLIKNICIHILFHIKYLAIHLIILINKPLFTIVWCFSIKNLQQLVEIILINHRDLFKIIRVKSLRKREAKDKKRAKIINKHNRCLLNKLIISFNNNSNSTKCLR
jgi:hypothetical protein